MADYYFDIETNPKGERPDFKGDDILTIQYNIPLDIEQSHDKCFTVYMVLLRLKK